MRVIYVAGAFRAPTQWGITQHVQKAERVSLELWRKGYAVICPHKMTEHFQNECPDKLWLDGCLELVKRSDAIYMLDNFRDSTGSLAELALAKELGLEILYEKEEMMEEEPTELENDLEERLLSARNMVDLTLLAFREDRHELIYTALEEAYYKLQLLIDNYCIVR